MHFFVYIDSSSGSIILQAIIGSLVGAGYIVRKNFHHIKHGLRRGRKTEKPDIE